MSAAFEHPRAYRGRLLTPLAGPADSAGHAPRRFLDDALLVVDARGRISSVSPFAPGAFQGPVRDVRPGVLLPGFVDAHVHFPQTRIIGSASGPLLDWLEHSVFPEEARFSDGGHAARVACELTERLLAAGTTTCAVFSSAHRTATHRLFEALERAGLRAAAGLTLMDQRCPVPLRFPVEEAIPAARDLIQRWHGAADGLLSFAMTPRFAVSCSRRLLEAAAALAAEHRLLVQTHVAENPAEGEEALREHTFANDYVDIYDRVGLLTDRTLLAHAIHLTPDAWDRVAAAGARIAHCPDSNFFLGSGRMRVAEARARGVVVALGSDVGAGRSFDMRRAMSYAFDNALCVGDRLTPSDLLTAATLRGAEALGLGDVTGSLEPGKEADFLVARFPDHATTEADLLSRLVFASEEVTIERVFVRGAPVHPRAHRA